MLRIVGETTGRADAVIARAVEDLPNVIGKEDVCRESLGLFSDVGCGLDNLNVAGVWADGGEGCSYEVPRISG